MKAFLPPADALAELLMRLRRTNISSEDLAVAVRQFVADEQNEGGRR